jgi:hypothetical protein
MESLLPEKIFAEFKQEYEQKMAEKQRKRALEENFMKFLKQEKEKEMYEK